MRSDTETIARAMEILADETESRDGVANAAMLEAAQRLRELQDVNESLKAELGDLFSGAFFDWDTMPEAGRRRFHEMVVNRTHAALRDANGGRMVNKRVRKTGGSFEHTGTVVADFLTTSGQRRIVLEFDTLVAGMLHVYRPDQVEVI